MTKLSNFSPDAGGHYGKWGGRFMPEVLIPVHEELEKIFEEVKICPKFEDEFSQILKTWVGRPTPLYFAENLSRKLKGARIWLKNEGLAHTGAHKINHCIGQALIAKKMGKKRIIAETGAGQHGRATASVCARFGLSCTIYMGERDYERQRPNVFWIERQGAEVIPIRDGNKSLKDAVNAAIKDWIGNVRTTHYLVGSCLGPHPFPEMNRYFQSVIGKEIDGQIKEQRGKLPDYIIASVGGGSNALGAFSYFLEKDSVKLIGVEAGGKNIKSGKHAARFAEGRAAVIEGYKSYWLVDENGQTKETHSISAGLDYAGIGPLHAHLKDLKRVEYTNATDEETLDAFSQLASNEGIIGALESCHAVAEAIKLAPKLSSDRDIVVNLSGRGDKDLFILGSAFCDENFFDFLKRFAEKNQ